MALLRSAIALLLSAATAFSSPAPAFAQLSRPAAGSPAGPHGVPVLPQAAIGAPALSPAPPALSLAPALSPALTAPAPLPATIAGPFPTALVPAAAVRPSAAAPAALRAASSAPAVRSRNEGVEAAAAVAREAFDGGRLRARPIPAPEARRSDAVVRYHGVTIPDPYQWLEEDTPETRAFVDAQNERTRAALDSLPERADFARRIRALVDYKRTGRPRRAGRYWVFSGNSGAQEQDVIYKAASMKGPREILLDPAALSDDGTVSVAQTRFSPDGAFLAYAVSRAGSDQLEWRVRSVETGHDSPGEGFQGRAPPAWLPDDSGYYYAFGETVRFHRMGTPSSGDRTSFQGPYFEPSVTKDGRFVILSRPTTGGSNARHSLLAVDLVSPEPVVTTLYGGRDAYNRIVGSDGDTLFLLTSKDAPRRRLVAVDVRRPEPENWVELIAEGPGRDVLEDVVKTDEGFIATWMHDAYHVVTAHGAAGDRLREIRLPGKGSVSGIQGIPGRGALVTYTSFNQPFVTLYASAKRNRTRAVAPRKLDFDPARFEVKQVFYRSKDGTKIPMFIAHKKGLVLDGRNPTYLHAYGGFGIPQTPSYTAGRIAWMEKGGVIAVANIRGGGEYGQEWHDAARLGKKQNSYDDFIAGALYLIRAKYTSSRRLAIGGGSNGGLNVGAVMTQRRKLFRAAVPEVGVLDLLNYERLGGGWTNDYGSVADKAGFENLRRISPLQNLKEGRSYPATLVMTGDHDDRVVPAHSHKFTAALQHAQGGAGPVFERIEKDAGHGGSSALSRRIAEAADVWAFLADALGLR